MNLKPAFRALFGAALLPMVGTTLSALTIVNGDFEAGNAGFSSAYTYVAPGGNSLYPQGVYTVDTNPINSHNLFYSMGDHTTGTGNMMIVNGDDVANTVVWQGSTDAALTPGVTYGFSAWVASVHPTSPAQLSFFVQLFQGETLLATLSPTSNGDWTYLSAAFTADAANTGPFKLLNANTAYQGNDFAIDDIGIRAVPDAGLTVAFLGIAMLGLRYFRRFVS